MVTPGGLDTLGEWRCLEYQKNSLDAAQRSDMWPGGVCDRRWADSTIISMGNAKLNPDTKPALLNEMGAPDVFEIPFEHTTLETVFEGLVVNETWRADAIKRQEGWMKQRKMDLKREERFKAMDKM